MTTLAALHRPGEGTWVGSDQMLSSGDVKSGPVEKWVVHPSGWAAGGAGHFNLIGVLQAARDTLLGDLPDPQAFVRRLRPALVENGFQPASEGPGPVMWGEMTLMLANPAGLWEIDSTLSVYRLPADQLWAAGSGREFALGAGHALRDMDLPPGELVRRAVAAAVAYDALSGFDPLVRHLDPAAFPPLPKEKPRRKRARVA